MICPQLLCITVITLCASLTKASPPVKHLQPPPSNFRRIPPPVFRPISSEPPGFMSRIARWFGFGDNPKEQHSQASYYQPQYREPPYNSYHQYSRPPKAPCNPCNNVPWIPMFPGNLQYPVLKSDPVHPQIKYSHHPNNNNFDGPPQHISLPTFSPQLTPPKQYAPAYNFPPHKDFKRPGGYLPPNGQQHDIGPIPLPNLSVTPIPPLYDAVPFHDYPRNNDLLDIIESVTHSSIRHESFPKQTLSNPNSGSAVEIIKSIPVTEFLSSIEYPADVVQSSVIDLSIDHPPPQPPALYTQPSSTSSTQQPPELFSHQPLNEELHQPTHPTHSPTYPPDNHLPEDVPHLTELGSYSPGQAPPHSEYLSNPIIVQQQILEPDSYPAASSHNISYRHENSLDVGNFVNPFQAGYESTTDSPINTVTGTTLPDYDGPTTVPNIIPFQPNLNKMNRETPKNLLDSPIYYTRGSSPRPFTRDPSDLSVRSSSSSYDHPNSLWQSPPTPTPWAFAPTPTSTYSALDASGLYAGISPPALFQSSPQPFEYRSNHQPKNIHQIIIPYTTNNKPTPFKSRDEQNDQPTDDRRYLHWSNSHEIDLHEQQESKVVTATETPGTTKTTKYLTKILVSNIHDLLKREHELKNNSKSAFDIKKLQKNIDDWTEQEFTSLSNKGSTVSVRGRSKNIPNEYLTTTPSLTQLRTGSLSTELPTTTASYGSLLGDDEIKKFDFLTKLVEDNRLEWSGPTSAPQVVPSTTESPSISPFYVRAVSPTSSPHELWNQLKVSISPLTKEKVYVVTPQPQFHHRTTSQDNLGNFKSPRFLVRPTPGVSSAHNSSSTPSYSPELFGLMGISAYSPAAPVETLDGHSKVITVVTPSATNKKRSAELETPTESTTTNRTIS